MPPNYDVRHYAADASILQIGTQVWGVTIGGIEVVPGPLFRILEGDGLTTEKQGMRRPIGWDSHIRTRLKDFSLDVMMAMSPGGASDGSSSNQVIRPQNARVPFAIGDYLQDVRVLYKVIDPDTGTVTWNAFVYGLAVVEPWTQSGEDSNEQARTLDIKGVLPSGHTADECPYIEIEDYDDATFDIDDHFTLA